MKKLIYIATLIVLGSCATQANYLATMSESKKMSADNYTNNLSMFNQRNLFFVELMINGKKGIFLVDTGASVSLLDINQAKNYDFKFSELRQETVVNGINGSVKQFNARNVVVMTTDNKFFLSRFRTCDLSYIVDKFDRGGIYILGVIGSDILKQSNAVIDYNRMQIDINLHF